MGRVDHPRPAVHRHLVPALDARITARTAGAVVRSGTCVLIWQDVVDRGDRAPHRRGGAPARGDEDHVGRDGCKGRGHLPAGGRYGAPQSRTPERDAESHELRPRRRHRQAATRERRGRRREPVVHPARGAQGARRPRHRHRIPAAETRRGVPAGDRPAHRPVPVGGLGDPRWAPGQAGRCAGEDLRRAGAAARADGALLRPKRRLP